MKSERVNPPFRPYSEIIPPKLFLDMESTSSADNLTRHLAWMF